MPRLIIVAGASGAGKSFLLGNIALLHPNIDSVKKLTTRSPRPYETPETCELLDLEFDHSVQEVTACDYVYRYGGSWYGTRRADIGRLMAAGKNPILIVRDCETIHLIRRDFPDCLVLYLQGVLSGADLREELKRQGRPDIDIEERMKRVRDDFYDYVGHVHMFDHVLINYYESDSLLGQMRTILRHVLRDETVHPEFVFVLMPFNKAFNEVFDAVQLAGKRLNGHSLVIERMDKQLGDFAIPDEILRCIRRAALIVVDVTENNPNVFFELGYARGVGKTVIHCAREGTKLPFDIRHMRHVFYASPMDLQKKMIEELRHFVSQGQDVTRERGRERQHHTSRLDRKN